MINADQLNSYSKKVEEPLIPVRTNSSPKAGQLLIKKSQIVKPDNPEQKFVEMIMK
jgi:hypothetical protein